MKDGIQQSTLAITTLMVNVAVSAANLPLTVTFQGASSHDISGQVCLNAKGALGCQSFFQKATPALSGQPVSTQLTVTSNVPGHVYSNAGIKLSGSNYIYGAGMVGANGFQSFSIQSSSPADFLVTNQSPNGTLARPYGVNDCQSREHCPSGVYLFTHQISSADIQKTLDLIYTSFAQDPTQPAIYSPLSEWSPQRFALLFLPGTYNVNVNLNYYTQLLGIGQTPGEVALTNINVDNLCQANDVSTCITLGALNNFWRGVENLTFNPQSCRIAKDPASNFNNDRCITWNVSQASPMRNVIINGDLMLNAAGCFDSKGQCNGPAGSGGDRPCEGQYEQGFACGAGYASGGFIANTTVNGDVHAIAQQQWFTRNSAFRKWYDSLWNLVFLNTPSATTDSVTTTAFPFNISGPGTWSNIPLSIKTDPDATPKEKPQLMWVNGGYQVKAGGVLHPSSRVVFMNAENHDVATINAQLQMASIDGLVIEPGVYSVGSAIEVPSGKFVLGLGMAELQCTNGNACLKVSGKNAIVAGLMLAAGYIESNELLLVDKLVDNAASRAEQTSLVDIFCRVGEANRVRIGNGPTAKNCVRITADYTVGDNLWLWRADHDLASALGPNGQTLVPPENLVTWTQDVTEHGLLVEGDYVAMLGLFSEHHGASNVLWNGNHGKTYFYQSELNYEAPVNWACLDFIGVAGLSPTFTNTPHGCPSYMLGPNVTMHQASGLGVYTYFQYDLMIPAAIITPNQVGIQFEHMVGRYLNSTAPNAIPAPTNSGFTNVLNTYGGAVFGNSATKGDGSDSAKTPALTQWQ